jgi:2-dehydropantoate 2-reductase
MATTFVVMGSGAIGCHVGGRLAAAGSPVVFVARPGMAASLTSDGLVVSALDGFRRELAPGSLRIAGSAAEAATLAGDSPFILLCTKGGATSAAAADLGAAFPAGTPVLSLQNGVDNVARIRAAAPGLTAIAGMVPFNVTLDRDADGRITAHRATSGNLHAEDSQAMRAVLADFARAGLPVTPEADMAAIQWGKLLLNLNNPVNALSGLPLREELVDRDYRRVLAALQREAMAVMRLAGIRPGKAGAAPPWVIPHILDLPTFAFSRIAASMLAIDAKARSSMWDDLQAGRETEIDDLCGAIVRLAAASGGTAPKNAAMVGLIRGHVAGRQIDGASLRQIIDAA